MGVADLNMKNHSGHALSSDIFGVKHVYRPARFFPSDRPPADAYVPALRATLPGRAVCKTLSLSRPVPQHGVRAANLSGEPSRYRSLSASTSKQTLSHGHPLQGRAQHARALVEGSIRDRWSPGGRSIPIYMRYPVGLPVYVRVRGWSRRSADTPPRPGDDHCTTGIGQKRTFRTTLNGARRRHLSG
jgi:hypothetical protein